MIDTVMIWKSGNSHVVIISPLIMKELGLAAGDVVELNVRRVPKEKA